METYSHDDELQHHGIKGMKWGRRRYQDKDGSLTPAGQKRYNKEMEKIQKEERALANKRAYDAKMAKLENARKRVDEQKAELKKKPVSDKPEEPKKKSISEMTDEEVRAYKQRVQNERDILSLQKEISAMTPKEKTAIEKFTEGVGGKIVNQVWKDVGKKQLNDFLTKALDVEKPLDELGKLKKEAELWKQKENLSTSKYNIWSNDYKKEHEIYNNNNNQNKGNTNNNNQNQNNGNNNNNNQNQNNGNSNKNQNKNQNGNDRNQSNNQSGPTMSKAERKARKQVDNYNKNWWENDSVKPVNDEFTRGIEEKYDYVHNTNPRKDIFGKGTSKYESEKSPIIDAEFYETSISGVPAVYENRGRKRVAGLLEDRNFRHSDDSIESLVANMLESDDDIQHYGIKGMKWGVHRFYNKDGSRTVAGKKRENEAKKYKNKDGALNDKGNNIASKAFREEYRAINGGGEHVKKVIAKYDKYKTDSQRAADKKHTKAMDEYYKYVDNYYKSNKDTQINYEHDYDHTKKGKKILNEVREAYIDRANQYVGEKWFSKYSNELANARLRDFKDNR